jgi:hypothetical protein
VPADPFQAIVKKRHDCSLLLRSRRQPHGESSCLGIDASSDWRGTVSTRHSAKEPEAMARPLKCAILAVLLALPMGLLGQAAMPPVPSGEWVQLGDMGSPRTGAAAALLGDGRVLVTGGSLDGVALASAEVLDTGGAFVPVADMQTGRIGHVAVALSDGRPRGRRRGPPARDRLRGDLRPGDRPVDIRGQAAPPPPLRCSDGRILLTGDGCDRVLGSPKSSIPRQLVC